jgi:HTH-type transcriptional regulator/antitoxin MqsA
MGRMCRDCGSREHTKRFEGKSFTVEHAGLRAKVSGLAGWRCGVCKKVMFDSASAYRYALAGDRLVLQNRALDRHEIRRIRRKLGLTQVAAARLTGGGRNAFWRYEHGKVVPLPAVINLLRLLDKHPELLKDLV